MNTNHARPDPPRGPACDRFEPLLSRTALGLLTPAEAGQLEAHVAGCPYCQHRQAAYDRLDMVFRREMAPQGTAPLSTQEILSQIRAEEGLEVEGEAEPPGAPLRWGQRREAPGLFLPPTRRAHSVFSPWVAAVAAVLVIALLTTGLVASRFSRSHTGAGQPTATASVSTLSPTATPPVTTPAPTATHYVPPKCMAPAAPVFPAGTYAAIDASGNFVANWVSLMLNADGSSNRGPRGCYVLAGQQFTITEFPSSPHLMNDCQSTALTGVYTWAYANKILRFTLVNDHCQERILELTSFRWEINPPGS